MQNTIKREYERTVQEDGSIDLSFNALRYLDNATNFFLLILLLAFAGVILGAIAPNIHSPGGMLFLWAVVIGGFVYTGRSALRHTQIIKIHPNKGIEFRGESIPFSEIQTIGLLTTKGTANSLGYLYVESNGKQVKVTKAKESLANALKLEIQNSSGMDWVK